jgi:hypothetical protein
VCVREREGERERVLMLEQKEDLRTLRVSRVLRIHVFSYACTTQTYTHIPRRVFCLHMPAPACV